MGEISKKSRSLSKNVKIGWKINKSVHLDVTVYSAYSAPDLTTVEV